jgi:hypothetical protein
MFYSRLLTQHDPTLPISFQLEKSQIPTFIWKVLSAGISLD